MSQPLTDISAPTNEGRIARSWRLTRAAWSVVRSDRSLLTLAAVAGITGAAGIAVIFAVGGSFGHGHFSEERMAIVALIAAYPLMFVSVFFNTAIAAAAAAALDGRHLSLGEALAVPMRRIGVVAMWSLIAAVVGVVLEQLASRLPLGGSIAARLVGVAWSLASLFAIPIIALEDCSAPEALKRSAQLIKKRWGEGIGGNVIISAWMILVMLPLIVVLGFVLAATGGDAGVRDAVIVVGILAFVGIVALQLVVRQTFAVALYRYATTSATQGPFGERDLQSPFSRKRGLSR